MILLNLTQQDYTELWTKLTTCLKVVSTGGRFYFYRNMCHCSYYQDFLADD